MLFYKLIDIFASLEFSTFINPYVIKLISYEIHLLVIFIILIYFDVKIFTRQ